LLQQAKPPIEFLRIEIEGEQAVKSR